MLSAYVWNRSCVSFPKLAAFSLLNCWLKSERNSSINASLILEQIILFQKSWQRHDHTVWDTVQRFAEEYQPLRVVLNPSHACQLSLANPPPLQSAFIAFLQLGSVGQRPEEAWGGEPSVCFRGESASKGQPSLLSTHSPCRNTQPCLLLSQGWIQTLSKINGPKTH